eukprot:TRINITY_DN32162_c0_g1_i1.p1 TRINITY_DN32162_c0_g1~~TRINITY_DN32162_c0_g1_i1.p1  ORF type:complete len:417 (-),score=87.87 TRINITY_DN32162_c0_g1_i1:62-1312(-)
MAAALGQCFGTCAGTFAAGACCSLAGSGTVTTAKAVKATLLWLQVSAAGVAITTAASWRSWAVWPCEKLAFVGWEDVGVCVCKAEDACWWPQLIYRAEAMSALLFLMMLVMAVNGCLAGAAGSVIGGKFMFVPLALLVCLFVGNEPFTAIGQLAMSLSALSLALQAVPVIDLAYTWNELWYGNALAAQRQSYSSQSREYTAWLVAILASSAALIVISMTWAFHAAWKLEGWPRALIVTLIMGMCALTILSLTDICKHGSLLASAVMMAYTFWVAEEAVATLPRDADASSGVEGVALLPPWASLLVAAATLCFLVFSRVGDSSEGSARDVAGIELTSAGRGGDEEAARRSAGAPEVDLRAFALQCSAHMAASIYIMSALAPQQSGSAFGSRAFAAVGVMLLYAWSLVAPLLLTGRSF